MFPALRANGTNGGTFCYETLWVSCPMLLFHCCYDFLVPISEAQVVATIGISEAQQQEGPSGEGEGEVSEWFMVLVLKTSVMQVTVGSNPTLSGFFWRCGQVVRQRIANSSLPSSNLGAAYVFCKNNFLIYSKRFVVVAVYYYETVVFPLVRRNKS